MTAVVEAAALLLDVLLLFFLPFLFMAAADSSPLDVFNDAVALVVLSEEELSDDSSLAEDVVEVGEVDLSVLVDFLAAEK